MGLFELNVDRIEITNVPKFTLFGGGEGEEPSSETAVSVDGDRSGLPVSPGTVLAVSIGATVLAFALARLSTLVEDGKLQC
jgi:hypothetical protein